MPSKTKKQKKNLSQITRQEAVLNAIVSANHDNLNLLRIMLKLSKPEDYNQNMEDVYDEASASYVVSSETNSTKPSNFNDEKKLNGNEEKEEVLEDCGSSETKSSNNRVDSKPPPVCPECGKTFPSHKSLYGHLRSHPNRGYKGAIPPPRVAKRKGSDTSPSVPPYNISYWGVKSKRCPRERETQESDDYIAAEIMVSMSRSPPTFSEDRKEANTKKKKKKSKVSGVRRFYQCSICNKGFPTHQALGGHRASHNKHRHDLETGTEEKYEANGLVQAIEGADMNGALSKVMAAVEHRCKTCNETFATGQALGGHMRRHYSGPPLAVALDEENARVGNYAFCFDLNEAPQSEEGGKLA